MMTRYIKVEGNPNLVRDKVSGAILNINSNEIKRAQRRKNLWLEEKEKQHALSNEVEELRTEIQEIKHLLVQLVEKNR